MDSNPPAALTESLARATVRAVVFDVPDAPDFLLKDGDFLGRGLPLCVALATGWFILMMVALFLALAATGLITIHTGSASNTLAAVLMIPVWFSAPGIVLQCIRGAAVSRLSRVRQRNADESADGWMPSPMQRLLLAPGDRDLIFQGIVAGVILLVLLKAAG